MKNEIWLVTFSIVSRIPRTSFNSASLVYTVFLPLPPAPVSSCILLIKDLSESKSLSKYSRSSFKISIAKFLSLNITLKTFSIIRIISADEFITSQLPSTSIEKKILFWQVASRMLICKNYSPENWSIIFTSAPVNLSRAEFWSKCNCALVLDSPEYFKRVFNVYITIKKWLHARKLGC